MSATAVWLPVNRIRRTTMPKHDEQKPRHQSSEPNHLFGSMLVGFIFLGMVLAGIYYILPMTNAVPPFLKPFVHHR